MSATLALIPNRVQTLTYPSGGLVTSTRDSTGRVTGLTWRASVSATPVTLIGSASYLPFGPLSALTYGNGRTQTKAYDQDYAIDRISGTPAGALTLDLSVDVMGDIASASATLNPTTPDRVYQYDPLYRLKTANTGTSSPLEAYTYTKTGDRLSAALNGGPAATYTYGATDHRLMSVGATARTYDANGNTLTGTLGVTGFTFAYDDRNRLATATKGTTVVTNQYNGRGERVSKTAAVSGSGPTAIYVYDEGGRLLADDTTEYLYLDSTPVGLVRDGILYYVETDHLGTPRQVVKPSTNTVVWKWDFLQNTFGSSTPNTDPDGDGTAFAFNLRFPGQYYDAESGLHYNYFRDYEAATGRYVESDPVGLLGGIGTYPYAEGNAFILFDSFGLSPCCDRAKAAVLAADPAARGYVACCDGNRYSCTIPDPYDDPDAAEIKSKCRKAHEDIHRDDTPRCLCNGEGKPTVGAPSPLGSGPSNPNTAGAECDAYSVSLPCFLTKKKDCHGKPQCIRSIEKELVHQNGQYIKFCKRAPAQ